MVISHLQYQIGAIEDREGGAMPHTMQRAFLGPLLSEGRITNSTVLHGTEPSQVEEALISNTGRPPLRAAYP